MRNGRAKRTEGVEIDGGKENPGQKNTWGEIRQNKQSRYNFS